MEYLLLIVIISILNFVFISSNKTSTIPLAAIMDSEKIAGYNSSCFFFDQFNWTYFDLTTIDRDNKFFIKLDNFTIHFNFCDNNQLTCNGESGKVIAKYADGSCKSFTTSDDKIKHWSYKLNSTDGKPQLLLTKHSSEPCNENGNFTTRFHFSCDDSMENGKFVVDMKNYRRYINSFSKEAIKDYITCERTLNFISKNACPRNDLYAIWKFNIEHASFTGMVFITIGFFTLFFGYNNAFITSYLFGVVGVVYSINLFLIFIKLDSSLSDILCLITILECFLGCVLGYFINKYKIFCKAFYGGLLGMSITNLSYFIAFSIIHDYPYLIYFGTFSFGVIVCSCLCVFFLSKASAIIFSSSFTGSLLIIRGIAFYAGGLPFEAYIIDLILKNENEMLNERLKFETIFYYIIPSVVLSIFGMIFQFKRKQLDDLVNLDTRGKETLISSE